MNRAPITPAQYAFADDFIQTFKAAINYVHQAELEPELDDFKDYQLSWCVALGVLAVDTFGSIIELFKADRVRTAWMMTRILIDCHVRLRYYILQTQDAKAKFDRTNRKHPKNYLKKSHAYVDWNNAQSKQYKIMQQRPLDLSDMPPKERAALEKALSKQYDAYQRNIKHMVEVVAADEEEGDWFYTSHLLMSGYMHGDQIALNDLIATSDNKVSAIHWETANLTAVHSLAEAVLHMLRIMESFKLVTGWVYGLEWAWRTCSPMFVQSFEAYRRQQRAVWDTP